MKPDEMNRRRGPGIPTARNIDHVAFTVPNLEEATVFFVEALGAALLYTEEPSAEGEWIPADLNVHRSAQCRIAMLRLGPTANIELFEYDAPDQRNTMPRNSDIGGHHMAVFVDDIDAAYDYIRRLRDVTCQGAPKTVTSGPLTGDEWFYFTTAWGLQLEVISLPATLPYERETNERRYGPAPPGWTDTRDAVTTRGDRDRLSHHNVTARPRVGVALPVNRMRLRSHDLSHIATTLEATECSTLWVNDHLSSFPVGTEDYPFNRSGRIDWDPHAPQYEALSICAHLSALTERLMIGTAVLVLPQRHPVEVSRSAATLADLSGGRFVLGVGAGWSRREMQLLGWDPTTRGARFDEELDLIRSTWGLQPPPAPEHYAPLPADVIFEPKPRPNDVPAVLIGGNSEAALNRVLRRGDGWLAVSSARPDDLQVANTKWAMLRRRSSRRLIGVLKVFIGSPDPDEARHALEEIEARGWDEVCFEFGTWDLGSVCALIDACCIDRHEG